MKRVSMSCLFGITLLGGCPGTTPNNTPDLAASPIDVMLAAPTSGFQLATMQMPVNSGDELQACYFYKVPDVNGDGKPFYVDKVELAQNVGSHHMNVFRQKTVVGLKGPNADGTGVVINVRNATTCQNLATCPCFYSSNWADWPIVANSQIPSVDANGQEVNYVMQMPPKVAYMFTPGEILMLQSHFVNASTQSTPGEAYAVANFDQMADPTGVQEVGTLFATEQSISICESNPTPTFSGFCHINTHNQPVTIFGANGHFHSRGTDFLMHTWDGMNSDPAAGTKFYESTTWDEPPMLTNLDVSVPVVVADGGIPDGGVNIFGGVSWTCSYKWSPSPACADGCTCLFKHPADAGTAPDECCYKFGPIVETSEHCNAFVYYYPKLDSTDISCQ